MNPGPTPDAVPSLDDAAYAATFAPPMRDVTAEAEEVVDLWSYADPVLAALFPDADPDAWRVASIYASADGRYQHLNVPVPRPDTYFVVVVDVPGRRIVGHRVVDLGRLYRG